MVKASIPIESIASYVSSFESSMFVVCCFNLLLLLLLYYLKRTLMILSFSFSSVCTQYYRRPLKFLSMILQTIVYLNAYNRSNKKCCS